MRNSALLFLVTFTALCVIVMFDPSILWISIAVLWLLAGLAGGVSVLGARLIQMRYIDPGAAERRPRRWRSLQNMGWNNRLQPA